MGKDKETLDLLAKVQNAGAGSTASKLIALTFDDGPSSDTTPKILDILERKNAVATFFLVGSRVSEHSRPIIQRQLALGCELANHSYTHDPMDKMQPEEIREQISRTSAVIKDAADVDVKFFRPPYIALSKTLFENVSLSFIEGISCLDWEPEVSAGKRAETILKTASDGSIVLLHDFPGNDKTVKALPSIIDGLRDKGFDFVTLSRLFACKGVEPRVDYKIWSNVYT